MKLIDNLGLKNFRIFDDNEGFFEEISSINILTGANNSGKSTIIKSLQMLKNSVKDGHPVFDLDLTQQEHLLGDFDNVLYNKNNKTIEISLPFTFLGLTNLYASLSFDAQNAPNNYKAKLRCIKILDNKDQSVLFSFKYRDATQQEKDDYLKDYEKKKKQNEVKYNAEEQTLEEAIFAYNGWFALPYDPLDGYVEWMIDPEKLKKELSIVKEFYSFYLENYTGADWIDTMDKNAEKLNLNFVPSILINSFKNDVSLEEWDTFLANLPSRVLSEKKEVCESDSEVDDFTPTPTDEEILYYKLLEILRQNLNWWSVDKIERNGRADKTYNVIENCFKSTWKGLIQRISTVNYLSAVKEQNSRIYLASSDSHFINLLKDFNYYKLQRSRFLNEYLRKFEIGQMIEVNYQPKYQLISVTITTLEGVKRELVDFGYGIKQLILILIQIRVLAAKSERWIENYNDPEGPPSKRYYTPSLLLVEEPEANLHPKWQSLLAELFVKANEKYNIQFVIETHSEYVIRKFQNLVAAKQFDGKKIKIFYLRNQQKIENKKPMSTLHIQDDGSIDYKLFDSGFFDESENLEFSLLNIQRDSFVADFKNLKNQQEENEAKIEVLERRIDAYVNKLDMRFSTQIIVQQFNTTKLLDLTMKYLASGQYLLSNIDEEDDFSPAILQFGRAVENELKEFFKTVNSVKKWTVGLMQGSLEKFKTGILSSNVSSCNNTDFERLETELANYFYQPRNLKIELLQDLREIRNSVAHSGECKTKQDAENYFQIAKAFLDSWTKERKI